MSKTFELFSVIIYYQKLEGEDVQIYLAAKEQSIKALRGKVGKVLDIESQIKTISKNMAINTKRSEFMETPVSDADVTNGKDLKLFSMTSEDDISAVAVTNKAYQPRFAKQLLNQMILDFRDFHKECPSVY